MAITQRGSVIVASDGAVSDGFGTSVALGASGTVLAVGAPLRDSGGASNSGGVYIYDYSGGSWTQRGSVLTQSTPDASDKFGSAVALSSDGTVLAVGAPEYWHDPDEYYGLVYVYDYTGGAWVLRGTVDINPANNVNFGQVIALSGNGLVLGVQDANTGDILLFDYTGGAWVQRGTSLANTGLPGFGQSFALSNDGTIAAVGGPGYDTPDTNAGAVAMFDYSGGTWTQRSALVQSADAAAGDAFGTSVALSSTGAVLASGSKFWEGGTGTDHGSAYLFDWSGTAWSERGMATAGDPANTDYFGSAIALSADASIMAVGAPSWEGTNDGQGGVYVFDITSGDICTAPTSLTLQASTGTASAPTSMTVTQYVAAATSLTVTAASGTVSAPTSLAVTDSATLTAPTAMALVDQSQHWPLWSAQVTIDGADVSASLTGQISVEAEEGAARIARFSILPGSGTVEPLDYVGKPVTIDYLQTISGATVSRRLFTGRIDTPEFDVADSVLSFSCVDDLQNRVAALDRSVLDTLIGGKYTAAVQGDILDNWDYAKARLTTVAASLDAGAHGDIRVTQWELASTWVTFTEADLIYRSNRVRFPQRSTLVNSVEASFEYRYPRLRQRYTSTGWSGTNIDMAPAGYQYPTQQEILGAAGGSGWIVTRGIFYPAPASIPHSSGGFIYPAEDAIDMAILYMAQRHSQTVSERYTLTVTAPESITENGTLPHTLRGALSSNFDGGAWESALDVAPLMPSGGDMDYAPDAPRADADYAIETLLDQARVKILGSHRSARVGNSILLNPDLDLDKRVAISTAPLDAIGKVARVAHLMDLQSGSATTEFDIAAFGVGGAGIITPDTLTAPTPPAEAAEAQDWEAGVASMFVNVYGITPYTEDLMGLLINPPESILVEDVPGIGSKSFPNPYYVAGTYPVQGFRVRMPGVDDGDRNPVEKTVSSSYKIVIPTDAVTFTVP